MSVAGNEQVKLVATGLNNLAVATVIAGFIGPVVALGSAATPRTDAVAIAASFVWLLVGVILHLCGRLILLRIKE